VTTAADTVCGSNPDNGPKSHANSAKLLPQIPCAVVTGPPGSGEEGATVGGSPSSLSSRADYRRGQISYICGSSCGSSCGSRISSPSASSSGPGTTPADTVCGAPAPQQRPHPRRALAVPPCLPPSTSPLGSRLAPLVMRTTPPHSPRGRPPSTTTSSSSIPPARAKQAWSNMTLAGAKIFLTQTAPRMTPPGRPRFNLRPPLVARSGA
jgi:hypothetical protein